jgi:septal ring factor EnvC (AmiA/AmiB activator)
LTFSPEKVYYHLQKDAKAHMGLDELSQFALLEQKIEFFISLVRSLKEEKIGLERKLQSHEEKINSVTNELETLKADKGLVRRRIGALLEKIEEFDLQR